MFWTWVTVDEDGAEVGTLHETREAALRAFGEAEGLTADSKDDSGVPWRSFFALPDLDTWETYPSRTVFQRAEVVRGA